MEITHDRCRDLGSPAFSQDRSILTRVKEHDDAPDVPNFRMLAVGAIRANGAVRAIQAAMTHRQESRPVEHDVTPAASVRPIQAAARNARSTQSDRCMQGAKKLRSIPIAGGSSRGRESIRTPSLRPFRGLLFVLDGLFMASAATTRTPKAQRPPSPEKMVWSRRKPKTRCEALTGFVPTLSRPVTCVRGVGWSFQSRRQGV